MKKWFVVRVQTGREHIIKKLIEEEISAHGLDEYVDEVFIPTKKVAKMSKKGKVTVDKRLYPGYIWIKMEDKEELMKVISGVRGVLYFAGKGRGPQPVKDEENSVNTVIPEGGCLGEVTVPFVKAYSSMDTDRTVLYRFYYAATFWILKRLLDEGGDVWYQLLDDRNYRAYYVPAAKLRLVPETELFAISKDVPPEDKKIVVDLTEQLLTAYEAEQIVFMSRVSTGIRLREGGFATPKGYYRTIRKRPCRHMANPTNDYGSGFDLPGVPWVSYFTSQGVAIHGAYWHNNFGVPYSHGCINMTPQAAKWVYRWTNPTVPPDYYYFSDPDGTRVIIQ